MALHRRAAEMSTSVQGRIKCSRRNSFTICLEEAGAAPAFRKSLRERKHMDLLKAPGNHFGEVQICQNEIHDHGGGAAAGIAMAIEYSAQGCQVLGSFQSIEIVGAPAERQSGAAKLLETFVVAQADAAPIVAL